MKPTQPPTRHFPRLRDVRRASSRILCTLKRKTRRLLDQLQGRKPVHLLHIGKTGGTALAHALQPYCRTPSYTIEFHSHGTTMADIPDGEKIVFFLRDPVSRFVSGFNSRKRQGQPRYCYPWTPDEEAAFKAFQTPGQLATALSADDVELRDQAGAAMRGIQHVRNTYWQWFESETYFLSRLEDVLFVGFLETIEEDFQTLKAKLGIPPEATLPDHEVETHRSPRGLDNRLDEIAIRNLRDWYRSDYEFVDLCKCHWGPNSRARGMDKAS